MRPLPFSKPPSFGGAHFPPAINQAAQDRYLWQGLGTETALRALGTYLETSPGLIEDMREAMRRREWTRLADLAHTFKSSTAIVGAEPLYEICMQLEAASVANTGAMTLYHLERVEKEYERVRLSLEAQNSHAEAS